MISQPAPLAAIVTTDLAAITRGRFVAADKLEATAGRGIGWVPANLSLCAFDTIADPNPWGSSGDLRILPDFAARFRTGKTGTATSFDMTCGRIVDLDGGPWCCCSRTLLESTLADLRAATGLSLRASFEQEFQLFGAALPSAPVMSFAGLRRADDFAGRLVAALDEAGVEPEVVIAEYGKDQFEITCAPAPALVAADRAVAIREITREIARVNGWRASFAPKTSPTSVGNGVHIHFSLFDAGGAPVTFDAKKPGGLSSVAASFVAGILRHLPALTAFTAPSPISYLRLKPHSWSASYTWIGVQDREATLRICPGAAIGGADLAAQYNIEYRAADATANPYLALAAIIRAGLEGLRMALPPPPLFSGDPASLSEAERAKLSLKRLPESLNQALDALSSDTVATGWFDPKLIDSFVGVRREEQRFLGDRALESACELYRDIY